MLINYLYYLFIFINLIFLNHFHFFIKTFRGRGPAVIGPWGHSGHAGGGYGRVRGVRPRVGPRPPGEAPTAAVAGAAPRGGGRWPGSRG